MSISISVEVVSGHSTNMGDDEVVVRRKKNDVCSCLTEEDIDKYNEAFTVRNGFKL